MKNCYFLNPAVPEETGRRTIYNRLSQRGVNFCELDATGACECREHQQVQKETGQIHGQQICKWCYKGVPTNVTDPCACLGTLRAMKGSRRPSFHVLTK